MRDRAEFREAMRLLDDGFNAHQVATELGVPWATVRHWKAGGRSATRPAAGATCDPGTCPWLPPQDGAAYAYLLGLYLGDGTIQKVNRSTQLRVFLDDRYPGIQKECAAAMSTMTTGAVSGTRRVGCTVIGSYSVHWKCAFPQHGPGRKHQRVIKLVSWQQGMADDHAGSLLRGLIHSDGCRARNIVKGKNYPKYEFCNQSGDIHAIFQRCADVLGIRYTTRSGATGAVTAVARRHDVALMDQIVGPKS